MQNRIEDFLKQCKVSMHACLLCNSTGVPYVSNGFIWAETLEGETMMEMLLGLVRLSGPHINETCA